jgi:transcriptional regulator GlxA family with amidase domain
VSDRSPLRDLAAWMLDNLQRPLNVHQHSLKRIAGECGFGNTKSMRGVFRRAQQDPSTLFFFPGWNKSNSP